MSDAEEIWLQARTQILTTNEWGWCMTEPDVTSFPSKEKVRVVVKVEKGRAGRLHISITEYGKRKRKLSVCLKPYTVPSLAEFLNSGGASDD
jgi:hypothetical protein